MAVFGNVITGSGLVNAPPGGYKAVSKFTLDRAGVIDHLLFVMNAAPANCMAVLYDATGSGGNPGNLIAKSAVVASPGGSAPVAFPFTTNPTLSAGSYWMGLLATTGGSALCQSLTNGIAYNTDNVSTGPASSFGTPTWSPYQYPVAVFYTPVLTAGTYYGDVLGGDALAHNYLANNVVMFSVSIPVPGTISKLTTFFQQAYPGGNVRGVIYDSTGSGGNPGNLLGATTALNSPAANGNDLVFSTGVHVPAGTYWIGCQTDTNMLAYHHVVSTPNIYNAAAYSSGAPSVFPSSGATSNTGSWCLWATFAADVVGTAKQPVVIVCS